METALRGRTEQEALELVVRANRGSDVTPGTSQSAHKHENDRAKMAGKERGLERKMKDCLGIQTFGLELVEKCKLTSLNGRRE